MTTKAVSVERDGKVAVVRFDRGGSLNAFNQDTSEGFFSVTNFTPDPITEVTFDFVASTSPFHTTTEFDTDNPGIGPNADDRFDHGNATLGLCRGTYRNMSDVNTGLIYEGPGLVRRMLGDLAERVDRSGVSSIADLRDTDTAQWAERPMPE